MLLFFLAVAPSTAAGQQTPQGVNVTRFEGNAATLRYLDGLRIELGRDYICVMLGFVAVLMAFLHLPRLAARLGYCRGRGSQPQSRVWSSMLTCLLRFKTRLLYAPLLHHRRAQEMKISQFSMGKLPTRFQAIFICLVVICNIFSCTWGIPWGEADVQKLPILRHRTGTLSVVNMVPLMVLASVKNPLIQALEISYDTFNLMHRWLGRLAILQAIVHTLAWLAGMLQQEDKWRALRTVLQTPFIYTGLISTLAMTIILFQAPKLVRSMSYEIFHHLHVILALLAIVTLYMHLERFARRWMLLSAVCAWALMRAARLATLVYRTIGTRGLSKAVIEPLEGDAMRVTLTIARPWIRRPGQSLYLTLPAIGLWTAHPFSVAWSETEAPNGPNQTKVRYEEKSSPTDRSLVTTVVAETEAASVQTMSLIVRKQGGMTQKLWNRVVQSESPLCLKACVEGPYGANVDLHKYETVVLVAGGVGITHQLGFVQDLVHGYNQGSTSASRVVLIWIIPTVDRLQWVRPWLEEILRMEGSADILRVRICITRDESEGGERFPGNVSLTRGRPDLDALVQSEVQHKAGAVALQVCAGGGLADDARRVSQLMLESGRDLTFIEEGFGW